MKAFNIYLVTNYHYTALLFLSSSACARKEVVNDLSSFHSLYVHPSSFGVCLILPQVDPFLLFSLCDARRFKETIVRPFPCESVEQLFRQRGWIVLQGPCEILHAFIHILIGQAIWKLQEESI